MGLVTLMIASLMAMATIGTTLAVQYRVTNNAVGTTGGNRFNKEIGVDNSKQVLSDASSFVWATFHQAEGGQKNVRLVTLVIESFNDAVAKTSNNVIHMSSDYIASYRGDVVTEFKGVMYHEMTHVWQWNGLGAAPGGLIEGIADYVRLKAGYAPSHWVKPGEGQRWDQGYDVTARFLAYCNDIVKDGFVADLNAKMENGYSDSFFQELLGKTVDQLWSDYKAHYGSS